MRRCGKASASGRAATFSRLKPEAMSAAGLPMPGTFESVAREWHAVRKDEWSDSYGEKIMRRLELDVFPWLGARPIAATPLPRTPPPITPKVEPARSRIG